MEREVARFFFELGQLKKVRRSGWWLAGVRDPESVAEHSFRTAAIAYVLALLEGADPERSAALAVFHDTAESRVNDLHRLGKEYVSWAEVEERAGEDQTSALPGVAAERIRGLLKEYRDENSAEARIAHDADRLECLLQAREYQARGVGGTGEWIESSRDALVTDSARRIATECLRENSERWW